MMKWLEVVTLLFLTSCFNAPINYAITPLKKAVDYLKEEASRCETVTDIYYYPDNTYNPNYFNQVEMRCPYTLNEIARPLTPMFIKRKYYNEYRKKYEDLGLVFPYYPRRFGDDGVIYPY